MTDVRVALLSLSKTVDPELREKKVKSDQSD